jgi:voltage-gated sodium channel
MMSEKKNQIKKLLNNHFTDEIITTIIIINAISLFLASSSYMHTNYGWWLDQIDHCCLIFFAIELVIRMYANGLNFFKNKWNIFDTLIVLISIPPHMGYFTALRALRILRLVRLIRFFPKMQFLILSIKNAIPGMISVLFFLSLFFVIFSIVTFNLFKGMNGEYFSSITHTLMSMFQLMINDGWAEIVRPVQKTMPYANAFFICYLIVMKFTLLNLFFGLIINSVQSAAREESKQALKKLKENIDVVTELEIKNEITLEHKVDALMSEIQLLRQALNKKS